MCICIYNTYIYILYVCVCVSLCCYNKIFNATNGIMTNALLIYSFLKLKIQIPYCRLDKDHALTQVRWQWVILVLNARKKVITSSIQNKNEGRANSGFYNNPLMRTTKRSQVTYLHKA